MNALQIFDEVSGRLPCDPPPSSLGLVDFRAGLARLEVLPPVVLYEEHWASIVVAGSRGPPALRRLDVSQFVALCRPVRALKDDGLILCSSEGLGKRICAQGKIIPVLAPNIRSLLCE